MSRYPRFDLSLLDLKAVALRGHDLNVQGCLPLEPPRIAFEHEEFPAFVRDVVQARRAGRPVIATELTIQCAAIAW